MEEDENELFDTLKTRAATYVKPYKLDKAAFSSPQLSKRSKRNSVFIKCSMHNPISKKNDVWKPENSQCSSCVLFNPSEYLPNGILPSRKSIIENLLQMKEVAATKGQKGNKISQSWLLSKDVALHWIFCNVYPKTPRSIQFIIDALWNDFKYLRYYDNRKKNNTYWGKYDSFVKSLNLVPDFIETNMDRRRLQEKLWNCKMGEQDKLFHEMQIKSPPSGYCSSFVDKKWKKSQERKESRLNRSRNEYFDSPEALNNVELDDLIDDIEIDPVSDPEHSDS